VVIIPFLYFYEASTTILTRISN